MPDPNARLKAIIHDAKLACRFKLGQVALHFETENERLEVIRNDVKDTFRRFDQPEEWIRPIPFAEFELLNQIIQLSKTPERDLNVLEENMAAFLAAFRKLRAPSDARNLLGEEDVSAVNLLVLNVIRRTRQVIEPKGAKFKESGLEPGQEEELDSANERYQSLFNIYRRALELNKVTAKKTDVNLFKTYHEAFRSTEVAEDFILTLQEYNDTIEERRPEPVP